MTRPASTLRQISLRTVSEPVLVWALAAGRPVKTEAVLGVLARIGLWLRLFFCGGDVTVTAPLARPEAEPSRRQSRSYARRIRRRGSMRKLPAHDLEMLMRFVPDAKGRGLTLNQYRERLTRLSGLGRASIYSYHFRRIYKLAKALRVKAAARKFMVREGGLCAAPLKPD